MSEKIRALFQEQGIIITSILMAIGMAISVLVEALLPGGAMVGQELPLLWEVSHHLRKVNGLETNLKSWLGYYRD